MANRPTYRSLLRNKLRDAADNLGKTDFSDAELNECLDNAPRRVFPNIYKVTEVTAQATDSDGRLDPGSVDAKLVFEIWDDDVDLELTGWRPKGSDSIVGLPQSENNFRFYHMAPYTMPADESTDAGIPDEYKEIIVLSAALDAIERLGLDRVDFTGYQPNAETGVDENEVLNLYNSMQDALAIELQSKGQSLPPLAI